MQGFFYTSLYDNKKVMKYWTDKSIEDNFFQGCC